MTDVANTAAILMLVELEQLSMTPSIAMSRRLERGANLKWVSASISLIPTFRRKLDNTAFKGAKFGDAAWYAAGVRYSTKLKTCALNRPKSSASVTKRCLLSKDRYRQAASCTKF